jgi:hypothetical protein
MRRVSDVDPEVDGPEFDPEDWRREVLRRYREAAEVTAAAREFHRRAEEIIAGMELKGVDTFGGLFSILGITAPDDADSEAR